MPEPDAYAAALRQTAVELLRLYHESEIAAPFEPLDEDAVAAWRRIAEGRETEDDLNVIELRSLYHAEN